MTGPLLVSEWYSQLGGLAWLLYLYIYIQYIYIYIFLFLNIYKGHCTCDLRVSLILAKPVSDHYVMIVASVTLATLMSNCDWMKELKSLLKANEIIELFLTLLLFLYCTCAFPISVGRGSQYAY